jgi:hypothetical protein
MAGNATDSSAQNQTDTIPNFAGKPPAELPPPAPALQQVETRKLPEPGNLPEPIRTESSVRAEPHGFETTHPEPAAKQPEPVAAPKEQSRQVEKAPQDPTIPLYRAREQGEAPSQEQNDNYKPQATDIETHTD